jgi:hypothetical protein
MYKMFDFLSVFWDNSTGSAAGSWDRSILFFLTDAGISPAIAVLWIGYISDQSKFRFGGGG